MSIEVDEMFEALTGGLDRGLVCDPHESDGVWHEAERLFQIECACGWEDSLAVCDVVYYAVVARKDSMYLSCESCGTYYKPFDLIKTTRQVNP